MTRNCRSGLPMQAPSVFAGFRFPPDVILLAVCWSLRQGLSWWGMAECFAERGIEVAHVTLFRLATASDEPHLVI